MNFRVKNWIIKYCTYSNIATKVAEPSTEQTYVFVSIALGNNPE